MSTLVEEPDRHTAPTRAECHYCGFEAEGDAVGGRRCPKCGGSSWNVPSIEDTPPAHAAIDRGAPPGSTQVRFTLTAQATAAYVFIGADGWRRRMVPMRRVRRDLWESVLTLQPRTYGYRFYVDDGERLLYIDPATSATSAQNRADATVTVHEPATNLDTAA